MALGSRTWATRSPSKSWLTRSVSTTTLRFFDSVNWFTASTLAAFPSDEAAGVEMVVRVLQTKHANDDELLASACAVIDALYAALRLDK